MKSFKARGSVRILACISAALAVAGAGAHTAVAQARHGRAPAAAAAGGSTPAGQWTVRWDGTDGHISMVQDDGMYCGYYGLNSGSNGWVSGTVAGSTLTGSWDGTTDGSGGLVLNINGANLTGTSGDSAGDATGHTLTGTRARPEVNFNFGRHWEGHWNGEATTLALTQSGTAVHGTVSGSFTGTIDGVVFERTLVAHYTDPAHHGAGRMILHAPGTSAQSLAGAASSDRTTCFGSWDLDFHL